MKLTKDEILNLFLTEKVASDDTYVGKFKLNDLLDKCHLISDFDKYNILKEYNSEYINTEMKHLVKISELLNNKIEKFSSDFWELYFFRRHNYLHDYDKRNFTQWNGVYEAVKDVNKKIKFLTQIKINSENLEDFLIKINNQQDGYIDFWFKLQKKNKNTELNEKMKSIILNYGRIDQNDAQKGIMLSYFGQVDELKNLYEKAKGTENQKIIENLLEKHISFEKHEISLFNEVNYHSIIYRKNIEVDSNALIYSFNEPKEKILDLITLISNFLKNSLYSISVKDYQDKYNFTVESYSEEDLNKKIDDIKKAFIHLPKLLLNSEYEDLIKDELLFFMLKYYID